MKKYYYGSDLAYVHDAGFGAHVKAAAGPVIRLLKKAGLGGGRVYDLGCGSGVSSLALARAGFEVLGVDASARMIDLAKRRAPGVKFITSSVYRTPLRECAAVTGIGEVFNYAEDFSPHKKLLSSFFRSVFNALGDKGLFIFDLAGPVQGGAGGPARSWFSGRDWAALVEKSEDAGRGILKRKIIVFRKKGGAYRKSEETHRQKLFSKEWVSAELRKAGFRVRVGDSYGPYRLTGGRYLVVAEKARGQKQEGERV